MSYLLRQVVPKSRHPDGKTLRDITRPWYSQKGPCLRIQGCQQAHVGWTYLPFADEYTVKPCNGQEVNDETVRMMLAALCYWLEDSQLELDEIWAEKKVEK